MKKTRLLLMLSAVLLLAMSFTSCKDDDDKKKNNPSKTLIGAWKRSDTGPNEIYGYWFEKNGKGTRFIIKYDSDGNVLDDWYTDPLEWTADKDQVHMYFTEWDMTYDDSYTVIDKDHIIIDDHSYTRVSEGEAKDLIASVKPEKRILGAWLETSKREVGSGISKYLHQSAIIFSEKDGYKSFRIITLKSTPSSPDYIFEWSNDHGNWDIDDNYFSYSINNGSNSGKVNYNLNNTSLELLGEMYSSFGTKKYKRIPVYQLDKYYDK